jgi:integrase
MAKRANGDGSVFERGDGKWSGALSYTDDNGSKKRQTEIGTPLEPRNVLRRFQTLARLAGLQDVHLHTLRHSTASFLLAAGTHTKVVQEHLGHSSYAITADIYSHVAPEQRREAADRLDETLEW